MSAISPSPDRRDDPRVVRSRTAVHEAARTLFLAKGYAGATMDDIAALAGIARRTLYNNYAGKDALFTEIIDDATAFAAAFAAGVREEFAGDEVTADTLAERLHDLGARLALGILRPEIIALRRLLVAEARAFPALAARYFERAPGQVLAALSDGFAALASAGVLHAPDPKTAAAQFAYLVVGEPLDLAMLTGAAPAQAQVLACAREGVTTFLARYAAR